MRRLALAAALALAAVPPAHAARGLARPAVSVMTPAGPVTDLVLANGLELILLESHARPVVSFNLVYRVGSRNEGPGTTGSCASVSGNAVNSSPWMTSPVSTAPSTTGPRPQQ